MRSARHVGWNNTIFGDHRNNVHHEKIFELDAVGAKPNCLSAQAARRQRGKRKPPVSASSPGACAWSTQRLCLTNGQKDPSQTREVTESPNSTTRYGYSDICIERPGILKGGWHGKEEEYSKLDTVDGH